VLALLAVASDPSTTERDAGTGNFSFVSHYADQHDAERGIVATAARSLQATTTLPRSHTHAMIVCGVAGFYAAEARRGSLAAQVSPAVLTALRPTSTPIVAALRAQRRLK
jgi:hypothetical protein